jgi:hypothetical protein
MPVSQGPALSGRLPACRSQELAPSTKSRRRLPSPARLMPPDRRFSPLDASLGVSPT